MAVFEYPFAASLSCALLAAFISFANTSEGRSGAFFRTLAYFPFWAVALIHSICFIVVAVQNSYSFRLARTYFIRDERRPSRPTLDTSARSSAYVTERDITSATPTSANYFRHV